MDTCFAKYIQKFTYNSMQFNTFIAVLDNSKIENAGKHKIENTKKKEKRKKI
jgi:hypothetical protein